MTGVHLLVLVVQCLLLNPNSTSSPFTRMLFLYVEKLGFIFIFFVAGFVAHGPLVLGMSVAIAKIGKDTMDFGILSFVSRMFAPFVILPKNQEAAVGAKKKYSGSA